MDLFGTDPNHEWIIALFLILVTLTLVGCYPYLEVLSLQTVQFHLFRPSTHISRDRLVSSLRIVQFFLFDRSLSFFETDFICFRFQDRSLSRTVHFESFGPSSLIHDRSVSVVWTVQFNHGSFTLIQDRPL